MPGSADMEQIQYIEEYSLKQDGHTVQIMLNLSRMKSHVDTAGRR